MCLALPALLRATAALHDAATARHDAATARQPSGESRHSRDKDQDQDSIDYALVRTFRTPELFFFVMPKFRSKTL